MEAITCLPQNQYFLQKDALIYTPAMYIYTAQVQNYLTAIEIIWHIIIALVQALPYMQN